MNSNKFDFKVFVACILLVLLIIGCSVGVVFIVKDNVAFADSTDGIVEDNLLLQNDFNIGSSYGQGWINGSRWWLGQSNSTATFNNKTLTGTNPNGYVNIRQWCDNIEHGVDLHYRVQTTSHTGNWLVQVWLYHDKNGSPSQGYTSGWFDADYKEGTFQISSSYEYAMFVIQCRNSITLEYAKLEYGSAFTGYVPNNYTNYGYEQGYNLGYDLGLQYGYERYNAVSGLSLIDSIDKRYIGLDAMMQAVKDPLVSGSFNHTATNIPITRENAFYPFNVNGNLVAIDYRFNYSGSYQGDNYDITLPAHPAFNNINVITSLYIGNAYVAGTYFLFDSTDMVSLLAVYNDNVKIIPCYKTNDIDGNSAIYLDNYLEAGIMYDFYIVPRDNNFLFLTNTALTLSGKSVVSGVGYYALYYISSFESNEFAYNSGYDKGVSDGTIDGYTRGKAEGYNIGWYDAEHYYSQLVEHGAYTFDDLMFSIVDSPISVLGSILDFNVFGVNIKYFIFGILTFAVCVLIIKKFVL